jgi:hypothetical protein
MNQISSQVFQIVIFNIISCLLSFKFKDYIIKYLYLNLDFKNLKFKQNILKEGLQEICQRRHVLHFVSLVQIKIIIVNEIKTLQ